MRHPTTGLTSLRERMEHHRRINVTITRFVKSEGAGPLKAFCDVAVGELILIRGIRIVRGRHGHFISMPRQLSKAGRWYESVVPITKEMKAKIRQTILEALEARGLDDATKEDARCDPAM